MTRSRGRNERGYVATEFLLGIGFLVLPVALMVLTFPTWSERQSAARTASQEAARVYVLTRDAGQAEAITRSIADNHGLNEDQMTVSLAGDPARRGGDVTATVEVKVPATVIPIMGLNADAFTLTERHTEVVDLYRSISQ